MNELEHHHHTYLVRKDGVRFCVVDIADGNVDDYLNNLHKVTPNSNWCIEPRFPVSGAD
jgi:hypothetical protein